MKTTHRYQYSGITLKAGRHPTRCPQWTPPRCRLWAWAAPPQTWSPPCQGTPLHTWYLRQSVSQGWKHYKNITKTLQKHYNFIRVQGQRL